MNWISAEQQLPMLNTPKLIKWRGFVYYGWRRASDGVYMLYGYYTEERMDATEMNFEWMNLPK